MTVRMTRKPQSLDTIVATNLHADILSDLAGALTGSLGVVTPSPVSGPRRRCSIIWRGGCVGAADARGGKGHRRRHFDA
jgi:isocitrate/isopropylmalate dehydrogenase